MASKVCLVLGAGPGLGFSLARKWASMGHTVVVTRRKKMNPEDVQRECGENVVAMVCDVTSSEQTKELVANVENEYDCICVGSA